MLLLAAVELVLFPVYDNASNVVFTRVGAIYPDAAKVTVRYPLPNETEHDVRLVWRQANNDEALPWVDGPSFHLTAEHDWVRTERLGGLWPDTTYECA